MSPIPVPTSSSVASRELARAKIPSSSERTARVPPNRAFARATSARERATISGWTSGSSRYSMPRRRDGVSREVS